MEREEGRNMCRAGAVGTPRSYSAVAQLHGQAGLGVQQTGEKRYKNRCLQNDLAGLYWPKREPKAEISRNERVLNSICDIGIKNTGVPFDCVPLSIAHDISSLFSGV